MTISVEIDDYTLAQLSAQAQAQGITVDAYVRAFIAAASGTGANGALSPAEFEHHLDELFADARDLPVLPASLSRADFYGDDD